MTLKVMICYHFFCVISKKYESQIYTSFYSSGIILFAFFMEDPNNDRSILNLFEAEISLFSFAILFELFMDLKLFSSKDLKIYSFLELCFGPKFSSKNFYRLSIYLRGY